MRLPDPLRRLILWRAKGIAYRREPDFVIGGQENPYLRRWWLIPRNKWFNLYLHRFLRSDDDRALHDHPWWSVSVLLEGSYLEHVPWIKMSGELDYRYSMVLPRAQGSVNYRGAEAAHRVELHGTPHGGEAAVWTLFITGPKVRDWGFWCPKGWRRWQDFCDPNENGRAGPGCD